MSNASVAPRKLRAQVLKILSSSDNIEDVFAELDRFPAKKVINPLISHFYHEDINVRWRAISGFGHTVARLASEDMESARVIMRRLMWSLNDESGGIGWGAPEAMAEAMSYHAGLASEYVQLLISYIREDGNFLEHNTLRKGALWGIMRLSDVRASLLKEYNTAEFLRSYLNDDDIESMAITVMAIKNVGDVSDCPRLKDLSKTIDNNNIMKIYMGNGHFLEKGISEIIKDSQYVLCP